MANNPKDEKIQLYRKVTKSVAGTTKDVFYRHFIYSEEKYISGGLWTYARALLSSEAVSSGLSYDKDNVEFTVNRNRKIAKDLKVIYRGDVYDISTIDPFDFRSLEITFTAIKTSDTTKYEGDEFDE